MDKELLDNDNVLNDDGTLKNVGWARTPVLRYNKEAIKQKSRIREWDYYLLQDDNYALCLSVGNLNSIGVLSATVVDFKNNKYYDKSSVVFFNKNKDFMSLSSVDGITDFKTKKAHFVFEVKNGKRTLKGVFEDFYKTYENRYDLEFDITIDESKGESMFKSTPFKKKNQFYLKHTINGMSCSGTFTINGKKHVMKKENSVCTFDWGRGVLPHRTTCYWANMHASFGSGKSIGFNLGKTFGDNSESTENVIFYNGKANKISDIKIYIRRNNKFKDYMREWTFYSKDGRLELMFEPMLDRYNPFNFVFVAAFEHQVFGTFTGKLTLDNGKVIEIDNMLGFAERVVNRW